MKEQLYYRLTKGFSDVGALIPLEDSVYEHVKNLDSAWFKSIYFYTEEQKNQAEELINVGGKSRRRGIAGVVDVKTNKIVFDFDHNEDIEIARKDAILTCERLISQGINPSELQLSFSGNKGYAIEVEFKDSWFTPKEVKNIVQSVAGDLETFDAVVVNASRIFRIPRTRHATSGLYKFPLSLEELTDIPSSQIREEAAKKDAVQEIPYNRAALPESILRISQTEPEKPKTEVIPIAGKEHMLDFSKMPKGFTKWKYALLNGYFPEGTRSHALIILASTLRYLGYTEITTYHMLKGAAELQSKKFEAEKFDKNDIWTTVISQVFGPSWRGACYGEESFDPKLQKYLLECGIPKQRKITNEGYSRIDGIYDKFKDFAVNIDANTIQTGIEAIDSNTRITTGMLFGLLAGAGAGKTSVALQILNTVSKNNEESIMFSMDMNSNLIYQKLSQKHYGYDGDQLFELFKTGNTTELKKIRYKLNENYKNVSFTFKTAMTVEDIKEGIMDHEEQTGRKVKFVVIDYLETILGPFSDTTANSAHAANALKDIASDLDVCVLLLLQTQKSSGDNSEPLRSMRKVKGSSVTEQACSIIISLWRSGFSPKDFDNDRFMTFCCVKNRMGRLFEVDTAWEGRTGTVGTLEESEREELDKILKEKVKQKAIDSL